MRCLAPGRFGIHRFGLDDAKFQSDIDSAGMPIMHCEAAKPVLSREYFPTFRAPTGTLNSLLVSKSGRDLTSAVVQSRHIGVFFWGDHVSGLSVAPLLGIYVVSLFAGSFPETVWRDEVLIS